MSNNYSSQCFDVADEDCASSLRVTKESAPMILTEIKHASPNENEHKEKLKAVQKKKRKVIINGKPNQGEATPSIFKPHPFKGLHVYLEYEGIKTLGSVSSYDDKKKLFKVEFLLEGKPTKYVKEKEILHNKATPEQVMAHNESCSNASKKKGGKCASRERSTPAREKRSSSHQKKKTPYVAFRIRASNGI